jgi:ADP-ribosylglycohydrolase
MVASAVGDAMGWPTEFLRPNAHRIGDTELPLRHFVSWQKLVGGRWWGYPETIDPGAYSDDTQLTLAVARCINDYGAFDPEHFAFSELPLWLHYERGGGRSIKTAAHALIRKRADWRRNFYKRGPIAYVGAGANGAAMRTLPIALAHPHDDDAFVRDCLYNAIITHGHPRALIGALLFGLGVRLALQSPADPDALVGPLLEWVNTDAAQAMAVDTELELWVREWDKRGNPHPFLTLWTEALKESARGLQLLLDEPSAPALSFYQAVGALSPETKGSGIGTTLVAVRNFVAHFDQPTEALYEAVNLLGSDTDTVATLTGALTGACFGWAAVPADAGRDVQDVAYLRHIGRRLFGIAMGRQGSALLETKRFERRDAYLQILAWEIGLHEMFWDAIGVGGSVTHPALGRGTIRKKEQRALRRAGYEAKLIHLDFESGQSCVFHSRIESGGRLSESLSDEVERALA